MLLAIGWSLALSSVARSHQKSAWTSGAAVAASAAPTASSATAPASLRPGSFCGCCSRRRSCQPPSRASRAPAAQAAACTEGSPSVMVPVLSNTTAPSLAADSRAAALFTRQPRFAATPVATMTAMGVASPMAQGHAIMSTAMPNFMAKRSFREPCTSAASACMEPLPMGPSSISMSMAAPPCSRRGMLTRPEKMRKVQTRKVAKERQITLGTKTRATRSATRCTPALLAWASCTSWQIWPRAVSQPTLVARMRQPPETQVVPPMTVSPRRLGTAVLSPVRRLSSTWTVASEQTMPSTAILPPGKTRSTSPSSTSSTGTGASPSLPQSTAEAGMLEGRSVMARMAEILARASRNLPSSTTATRMGPMVKKWLVAMESVWELGVSGMSRQKTTRPAE
mmetsp:Transcript_73774/g.238436  ORF Transcript_73774/g.238436 Transcript_73774/m.238436 type:complete len:396 (-) Transcript_73774:567-1754(-)